MRPLRCAPTVLLGSSLLAGCHDQPIEPVEPETPPPAFTIVDGARGGNPAFFFLPPMVKAPAYAGTFDPTHSPVVAICVLAGASCGTTVTSFSGSAVKLDLTAEAYGAVWKTRDAGLDPAKTYRIQVLTGTTVLGFADVVVLDNGNQIKTIDRDQYVTTINGGALAIRFRIEQAVPPPPPPPPGPWQNGDLITYNQDNWGTLGTPASNLLGAHFFSVFLNGYAEIGLPSLTGYSAIFGSANAVVNYLPATGVPGPLGTDLSDPTSTSSGVFGGHVLALKLDVDFADAGHLTGASGLVFGDLRLCGLGQVAYLGWSYNDMTVRQFLAEMNTALGGGPVLGENAPDFSTFDALAYLTENVTSAFEGGVPSQFAQDHIVNGACPTVWHNGDLITYIQAEWGTPSFAAGALLSNHYSSVYASAFGIVEVGLSGSAGHSIQFTSSNALFAYLPSAGMPAPLNADLVDPTSTASGVFGGEVLGLRLNIDWSDAGHILGTSNVRFGDLLLCGLTGPVAGLSGLSVRAFQNLVNTALGGGATSYAIVDLSPLLQDVNAAFIGGIATQFAQDHVRSGTCS